MSKLQRNTVLALLSLLIAATALGADPRANSPAGSGQAGENEPANVRIPDLEVNQAEIQENPEGLGVVPELREAVGARNDELMLRLHQVRDAAHDRLMELEGRLASATDNTAALELVKQIERVKVGVELDLLREQAVYAREMGREELALEIETALNEMTSPRPRRQPVERPAPAAGQR